MSAQRPMPEELRSDPAGYLDRLVSKTRKELEALKSSGKASPRTECIWACLDALSACKAACDTTDRSCYWACHSAYEDCRAGCPAE